MKKVYIAVQICENGKYYAYCFAANETTNILSKLAAIPHAVTANIFTTKKAAAAVISAWNAEHKMNNRYIFDETF